MNRWNKWFIGTPQYHYPHNPSSLSATWPTAILPLRFTLLPILLLTYYYPLHLVWTHTYTLLGYTLIKYTVMDTLAMM